jgi:histidinol-phosphate phosphatase family protein
MNGQIAVFLDLQGTLGGEGLGDIRHFAFYPFAIPAIKLLNTANLLTVIITNQSHIAKGEFTYEYFKERMRALQQEVEDGGARLDAVYCCPHGEKDDCTCKKPKPGLVVTAQKELNLDLNSCYVVGDTGACEMVLAQSINSKGVLVRTGLGESSLVEYRHTWRDITPHFIAGNVLDAAKWIIADRAFNDSSGLSSRQCNTTYPY